MRTPSPNLPLLLGGERIVHPFSADRLEPKDGRAGLLEARPLSVARQETKYPPILLRSGKPPFRQSGISKQNEPAYSRWPSFTGSTALPCSRLASLFAHVCPSRALGVTTTVHYIAFSLVRDLFPPFFAPVGLQICSIKSLHFAAFSLFFFLLPPNLMPIHPCIPSHHPMGPALKACGH